MENGFVLQQEAQTIQDLLNYIEQQLPGTLQALSNAIGDETTRATNKENELSGAIGGLIPKSEKGRANGVASLNAGGQVPNEQLQWSMRGALNPSDIDSTSLVAGIYQVNGKVLSPAILGGDGANGVMIQYPWGSRVQLLLVGRGSDAPAGEQVEIYVRRYLPTPQRWTAWMTTADFAKKSDIPESDFYVVEFEDRGGSVTTKQSISDIFAARDSGKQIIGTLGGRSPVYFYFMGGDAPDKCPLISLRRILNGIAYYEGYDINLDGTITRFNYQVGVNASNFIQKSSTAGLVKNDGTIDQTTYATGSQLAQLSDTVDALDNDVDNIEVVIPSAASAQNQLADKDFVNHSVATNTANFIGTFASVAELEAYSGTLTNNDYAFVIVTDAQGNEFYDRYKYNANATPPAWLFEYRIESTAFTAAQWAAIQSGITASLVTKLSDLPTNTALQEALTLINTTLSGKQDTISDLAEIRSGASAGATAYQKPQGGIPASDIAPDVIPDVSNKENKTTIVAAYNTQDPSQPVRGVPCNLSTYYRIPVPIESLTLLLPPNPQSGYVENIVVYLTGGTTPAVTIQSSDVNPAPIYYHDGYAIESGKTYEINILWNGAAWVVASVEIVINN